MADAMKLLRVFKQNTALSIALYDLAAIEPVEKIVQRITQAADCAVQGAVSFLFRQKPLRPGHLDAGRRRRNPVAATVAILSSPWASRGALNLIIPVILI